MFLKDLKSLSRVKISTCTDAPVQGASKLLPQRSQIIKISGFECHTGLSNYYSTLPL